METGSFSFLPPIPPIQTRGVFGNDFLTRVDWCRLEPVFHFLLHSKKEFVNVLRGMWEFGVPEIKAEEKRR